MRRRRLLLFGLLLLPLVQYHIFNGSSVHELSRLEVETLVVCFDAPAFSILPIPKRYFAHYEDRKLTLEARSFYGVVWYRINAVTTANGFLDYCRVEFLPFLDSSDS